MRRYTSASLESQHETSHREPSMANQKERRAAPRTTGPQSAAGTTSPQNAAGTTAPRTAASAKSALSNEEVYRLIAETAYFKAKARGFEPGGEVRDWIEAEAEIRQHIERKNPQ